MAGCFWNGVSTLLTPFTRTDGLNVLVPFTRTGDVDVLVGGPPRGDAGREDSQYQRARNKPATPPRRDETQHSTPNKSTPQPPTSSHSAKTQLAQLQPSSNTGSISSSQDNTMPFSHDQNFKNLILDYPNRHPT